MGRARNRLKIDMICTGNELLDGSIADTNTQRLAQRLKPLGLRIRQTSVVPDDAYLITKVFQDALGEADVIVFSGGLGPTSDDLTVEIAAQALGLPLVESREAKQNVVTRLKKMKRRRVNASNMKQALVPEGARVIRNAEGTAPGLHLTRGAKNIFFLPGVPREFDHLVDHGLMPFFDKYRAEEGEHLFVMKVFGWPESELNELMKSMKVPTDIQIGYRTSFPENHLKLQVRAKTREAALRRAKALQIRLRQKLGEALFSESLDETYGQAVVRRLIQKKTPVSVAESCTGGLISSMITSVAGSSRIFDRGFVTYSNLSKIDLLGVRPSTLDRLGAVSEETAKEMVLGALQASHAELAVAVTGIAGPTGGTKEKPVGTVWIAAAKRGKKPVTKLLRLSGLNHREMIQKYTAYQALKMILDLGK